MLSIAGWRHRVQFSSPFDVATQSARTSSRQGVERSATICAPRSRPAADADDGVAVRCSAHDPVGESQRRVEHHARTRAERRIADRRRRAARSADRARLRSALQSASPRSTRQRLASRIAVRGPDCAAGSSVCDQQVFDRSSRRFSGACLSAAEACASTAEGLAQVELAAVGLMVAVQSRPAAVRSQRRWACLFPPNVQ